MQLFILALGALLAADKPITVQPLDLGSARPLIKEGRSDRPTLASTAEELDKLLDDKDGKIKKQVDFKTQQVVLFYWAGSGGDRLSAEVQKGDKPQVVFQRKQGLTYDLRQHLKAFVIPRDTPFKIETIR